MKISETGMLACVLRSARGAAVIAGVVCSSAALGSDAIAVHPLIVQGAGFTADEAFYARKQLRDTVKAQQISDTEMLDKVKAEFRPGGRPECQPGNVECLGNLAKKLGASSALQIAVKRSKPGEAYLFSGWVVRADGKLERSVLEQRYPAIEGEVTFVGLGRSLNLFLPELGFQPEAGPESLLVNNPPPNVTKPLPTAPAPPPRAAWKTPVGFGAAVVGVGLAGLGVWQLASASQSFANADRLFGTGGAILSNQDRDSAIAYTTTGNDQSRNGAVLVAGGVVAGAAAVYLLVVDPMTERPGKEPLKLQAWLGPTGGGVFGRF